MDYYLNEYSLRGQYSDIEDFFGHLREETLPVLNKIQQEEGNVIWKKNSFWESEICRGVCLTRIPLKRNERSGELPLLMNQLIKLAYEDPFWEDDHDPNLIIEKYEFDEEYSINFEQVNCFTKAIENEGRVISFFHKEYVRSQLPVIVKQEDKDSEYNIDNIYTLSWWDKEPEIRTWRANSKYSVQVRANEFDYHPPHFHVIYNEYSAVFKVRDGSLYKDGRKKWTTQMIAEVQEWYQIHNDELQEAWENLHGKEIAGALL